MSERLIEHDLILTGKHGAWNLSKMPIVQCMQKLQEYEDLEELGLLVRLPCKQFTTVYYIIDNHLAAGQYLAKATKNVSLILTDRELGICWCKDDAWFYTCEAAEKALTESEDKND